MQGWFNIYKSTDIIQHITKIKDKNHIIISIGAEKLLNKIQQPFVIKVLKKLGMKGMYLNVIEAICGTSITNIILNRKKLKAFSLYSEMIQGCPYLLNIVL
jgi:hypothetical protein